MNKFLVGVLVVVALASVGSAFKPVRVVVESAPVTYAGLPGNEALVPFYFRDTVTLGGSVLATTSQGTVTYTAANITKYNTITHTASAAATVTLPASSTLTAFVPKAGDTATRFINPVTTSVTVAAGTGTELNTASSTKVCLVNTTCRLDFVRKANSDIEVLLTTPSGN